MLIDGVEMDLTAPIYAILGFLSGLTLAWYAVRMGVWRLEPLPSLDYRVPRPCPHQDAPKPGGNYGSATEIRLLPIVPDTPPIPVDTEAAYEAQIQREMLGMVPPKPAPPYAPPPPDIMPSALDVAMGRSMADCSPILYPAVRPTSDSPPIRGLKLPRPARGRRFSS